MASFVGGCVDFVVCLVEWVWFVWYIAFIALVVVIWILFAVLGGCGGCGLVCVFWLAIVVGFLDLFLVLLVDLVVGTIVCFGLLVMMLD